MLKVADVVKAGEHPADDPIKVAAMGLAISLRDITVARSLAREILAERVTCQASK